MTDREPITTCDLCGTEVKIVGDITRHYEPITEWKERAEKAEAERDKLLQAIGEHIEIRAKYYDEIQRLKAQCAVYREALEDIKYRTGQLQPNSGHMYLMTVNNDYKQACKALASTNAGTALLKVVRAAEALLECFNEFPKGPSAWGDYIQALDDALYAYRGDK